MKQTHFFIWNTILEKNRWVAEVFHTKEHLLGAFVWALFFAIEIDFGREIC